MLKTFRKGGIHPPENKLSALSKITDIPQSKEYVVSLSQHIGAPAQCCVEKGEHIAKYQLIGKSAGFVSANIHSPVSGTVRKIDKFKNAFGFETTSVFITPDGQNDEERHPLTSEEAAKLSSKEIIGIIDNAGIVGLGGATFPTKVKLMPPDNMPVDTLLINGAECEPYLTNDQRLMEECPEEIIEGVKLLMRAINVEKAYIAIESNKPEAIKALEKAAAHATGIKITPLKVKYPQGGEKQLIDAVLNRQVPSGGLPASVGVIVQNVATAYAVKQAVIDGTPLTERVITVTGPDLPHPGNYRVPIGTPISDIIEAAGGLPENTQKVVIGGPMMGKAASNLNATANKGMSGILIVPKRYAMRQKAENCVRCASCVSACPMGLEPYLIARLSELKDYKRLEEERVMDCIECGSCSYVCISHRPLLDYIRIGKNKTGAIIKSRKTNNK